MLRNVVHLYRPDTVYVKSCSAVLFVLLELVPTIHLIQFKIYTISISIKMLILIIHDFTHNFT